jgi:hypothetical protein
LVWDNQGRELQLKIWHKSGKLLIFTTKKMMSSTESKNLTANGKKLLKTNGKGRSLVIY